MHELTAKELTWECPHEWIPWKTSAEIEPADTIVGQERAVDAISFGLAMGGIGFNVFVTGLAGTGRLTTIKQYLEPLAGADPTPDDVCFVYNFRTPEEPHHLCLNAGAGQRLRDGMQELIQDLAENLPNLLKSKEFRQQVERAVADLKGRERELVEGFDGEVKAAGFALVQIQAGPMTRPEVLPIVGETPVPVDKLASLVDQGELSQQEAVKLEEVHAQLASRLQEVFLEVSELREQLQHRVEEVRRETVRPVLEQRIARLEKAVADKRAHEYLDAVQQDIEENLAAFLVDLEEVPGGVDPFLRWRVNLVVDNAEITGKPVVRETEPSYSNMFGTIERTMTTSGEVTTSHLKIRAGSLLRANGGYLVLNAEDVLQDVRVWSSLKRALKYSRVRIQSLDSLVLGASALKPEEIPLDVKVVVIGSRSVYDVLYRYDTDFSKVFKVLADFDSTLPVSQDAVRDALSVLVKVGKQENLLPMNRSGMAALIKDAVRQGRWRHRLSTRFSDLADLYREAAYCAGKAKKKLVSDIHVQQACEAQQRRHSLSEDRTHELLVEGVIRVDTEGAVVGQVNGLAVYDLGHHRFGKPARITARVGLGREGVINIERHSGLSGPTHDKGVQILTGFLRGTFARTVPLTMGCSITFEQSYGGIDGDSASSTEVYAILSALADLELRQDIAVTGSVDQYGGIQAIGGVNQKIEGYFHLCNDRKLSGDQGVLIPQANVGDLHLARDVVAAVDEGTFHVWAIQTIEEGIELLTGVPAGQWSDEQGWSEGSVFGRCQHRLEEMARLLRRAGKDKEESEPNGDEASSTAGSKDATEQA